MLFILETKKVPQLRVFYKGKVRARFIPENRGTEENPVYVGVFKSTDEKLVNFILKRCRSAGIVQKRMSDAPLRTLESTNAGKAKPTTTAKTANKVRSSSK